MHETQENTINTGQVRSNTSVPALWKTLDTILLRMKSINMELGVNIFIFPNYTDFMKGARFQKDCKKNGNM